MAAADPAADAALTEEQVAEFREAFGGSAGFGCRPWPLLPLLMLLFLLPILPALFDKDGDGGCKCVVCLHVAT